MSKPTHPSFDKGIMLFVAVFALVIAVSFWLGKIPVTLLFLYILSSLLAFIFYLRDKIAAKNDEWRVKESTLLWLGLIGGWPGALIAQQIYRHKTSKTKFQLLFWPTVIINCLALAWWIIQQPMAGY
ncbi:DUF1294 domain-containing protein [Pragia fontium]|uniref:Uncharacterized membrane protein YsdA, DUF1294 family n=1 Tax=Pragia fontium DSM 5563 = ATCC 49100 TaxID=1122977 RepID=A0AAJ4WD50_9GAMM|nr:DUF1294 domain-containing protein [Pragia fontium]SFD34722.1 Uncharacterized membrane protein YsdA, DUF1294 family [Pragia fontium DSM 5563 = ATCC 49100]